MNRNGKRDSAALSGSAGLDGVQWAFQGPATRRMLRGVVAGMLPSGSRFGPLNLTRAKFKPNRKINAYYSFSVCGPGQAGVRVVPMAVTWQAQTDPAALAGALTAAQADAERHGLLAPFIRLWQAVPERNLLVQVWPLDPAFPRLARLSDPAHAAGLLREHSLLPGSAGPGGLAVDPVRYRPGERHVLRFRAGQAGETFYGKVYEEPQAAARAYRIANRVVDCLEAEGGTLRGARPVALSEAEGLILYPRIGGSPLSQQLRRSPGWLARQLEQAGQALHRLHSGPPELMDDLKANTFEKEVKAIQRACEHIQTLLPETGAQILGLLETAGEVYHSLPREPDTFTHSDFKADHLLVDGEAITLIDFDTCAAADPALDLGKFLADLQWWFTQHHLAGVEQAQKAFLAGYYCDPLSSLLARARLFEVLVLIKITARRVRLYGRDWAGETHDLISRAERQLAVLA